MSVIVPTLSLLASLSIGVADRLPDFDLLRSCRAAIDAVGSPQVQSVQQCISDERSARAEIESQWSGFPASLRTRCVAETQIGGSPSYVDVLECLSFGSRQNPM